MPSPSIPTRRASNSTSSPPVSFAQSSNPDYVSFGSVGRPGIILPTSQPRRSSLVGNMRPDVREELLAQEEELLEDNHITRKHSHIDSERTLLLSSAHTTYDNQLTQSDEDSIDETFRDSVAKGMITTSYKREIIVLMKTSIPVSISFVLQYSLVVASILCVGHLGKKELSAVSVASMIANIVGYGIFQGIATSLDTLASQAFGRKDLAMVGIHTQQCALITAVAAIPISLIWIFSKPILNVLIPEHDLVILAAQYLRILVVGIPGYVTFEIAKHYLQSQGIFHASTYILMICAPLNLLLNYVLVWNKSIGLGFIGAPIAVIITDNLMAILSILYICYIDGSQCWNGFSSKTFRNLRQTINLGCAGILSTLSEWLAFEILTFFVAHLGTTELASQSILGTVCGFVYQIPLSMGIVSSTRVGNLVGAKLGDAAALAGRTHLAASVCFGIFNCSMIIAVRNHLGSLFTSDKDVIVMVAQILPITALFQVNDCIAAVGGGILRGQGRQKISGYINLVMWYLLALPLGLHLAFVSGWGLQGIWSGVVVGLFFVSTSQIYFFMTTNWDKVVENAQGVDHEGSV